jgi:hypothetical protein
MSVSRSSIAAPLGCVEQIAVGERGLFRAMQKALHVGHVLVTRCLFQDHFFAEDADCPSHRVAQIIQVSRVLRRPTIERGVVGNLNLRKVVVLETAVHFDIFLDRRW